MHGMKGHIRLQVTSILPAGARTCFLSLARAVLCTWDSISGRESSVRSSQCWHSRGPESDAAFSSHSSTVFLSCTIRGKRDHHTFSKQQVYDCAAICTMALFINGRQQLGGTLAVHSLSRARSPMLCGMSMSQWKVLLCAHQGKSGSKCTLLGNIASPGPADEGHRSRVQVDNHDNIIMQEFSPW